MIHFLNLYRLDRAFLSLLTRFVFLIYYSASYIHKPVFERELMFDVLINLFNQNIYTQSLAVGVMLVALRVVSFFIGGLFHTHDDFSHHDFGHDDYTLSLQTLAAFTLGFALGGLIAQHFLLDGFNQSLIALVSGFVLMRIQFSVVRGLGRLASNGSEFKLSRVVGLGGEVYLSIPPSGLGKILVTVDHVVREIDAASADGSPLQTMTKVTVVDVSSSGHVLVKALQ